MSLKEQLSSDLKDAMRSGDEVRKSTLRMLIAAIGNAEVAGSTRHELADSEVIQVLAKQVKQRKESIDEFEKAGRQDLADKESAELKILQEYMPQQMSRGEIAAQARTVIEETGATGPSDRGKVMKELMPRLAGKAEGREINEVVNSLLGS